MSNFTSSNKKKLSTWLDSAGFLLDVSRFENESLFHYQQRLIDTVRNKGNTKFEGINNTSSRELGLEKIHSLTISSEEDKPSIKVSSKYIYFYSDDELDFKLDLYNNTFGDLKSYISFNSLYFSIDYYNEETESLLLKKIFYGGNIRSETESLIPSKCAILQHQNLISVYLFSETFKREVASIEEITEIDDFFIDYKNGIVYSGQNCTGKIIYNYYENPFKIYYNPVSVYPLNDHEVDLLIKDSIYLTSDASNSVLNSFGGQLINQTLRVGPTTIGK